MRWRGRAGSGNIEDRRGMGMGMALPIGGGIGGLVLLLLFTMLTGQSSNRHGHHLQSQRIHRHDRRS